LIDKKTILDDPSFGGVKMAISQFRAVQKGGKRWKKDVAVGLPLVLPTAWLRAMSH
jgi:hypothetical protein